jgi:uncharacterized protein (DUF2252 family)
MAKPKKDASMAKPKQDGAEPPATQPEASANDALEPVAHPSSAERQASGETARKKVPFEQHATWKPPPDRADPVELLEEQAKARVPELVPIRYGRMLTSPFAFYRGGALIMASDLASTPRSGFKAQLSGDAHISNFGLFASPEREMLFDVNDFDETLPGPWEWDLKRLAASIAVAGRMNGFSAKQRKHTVSSVAKSYRTTMAQFSQMSNLPVWYSHAQVQQDLLRARAALDKKNVKQVQKTIDKAHTMDSMRAFNKLTHVVNGQRQIISNPPLIIPIEELLAPEQQKGFMARMTTGYRNYRHSLLGDRKHLLEEFRITHLARKVVGVGSVGTRCWIILLLGRDDSDPLFLQAKEAQASVLERYVAKSVYSNHGQRVVEGQRFMQTASDIFLGWDRIVGIDGAPHDFYFRQLYDWKGSWAPESMDTQAMAFYGSVCAWTLARAHARSGDRIAIAAYLGDTTGFDHVIAEFAEAYADQNERDYAALKEAAKSGRITVRTGV